MSLYIDVDKVLAVLLQDGWHHMAEKSFRLDAYEFHDKSVPIQGGVISGGCAIGFTFKDSSLGQTIAGPLTSVLAVKLGGPAASGPAVGVVRPNPEGQKKL